MTAEPDPQSVPADVPTTLPDLSAVRLADLTDQPGWDDTLRRLLGKAEQPGRSISGYNPQRLD